MGWEHDHIVSVANRYKERYQNAGNKEQVIELAKKELAENGWPEKDANYIISIVLSTKVENLAPVDHNA